MSDAIDITASQRKTILSLLEKHLPDVEVWVYGSRANWTARPESDLDMVVFTAPEQSRAVGDLKEAFDESDLPFRVDLFIWDEIPDSFKRNIKAEHVVLRDAGNAPNLYRPQFPMTWERHSLHDLADWINGMAFRNIHFSPTGKPVVKIAEIKNGLSGQTKYTQAEYDEKYRLKPGDMLFSWSGQPETSIDAFWWRGPEGWLNQHIFKVLPKDNCEDTFFYYLLKYLKPHFIRIAHNKQTTGLGHVTKTDLQRMEVAVPKTKKEQKAIAHILGTLDDKIELNRRMNETLESIARTIFKSWFIDFDPVRAKAEGRDTGLPKEIADLFPDEFEDSELGEIPMGWQVGKIGDTLELAYGKSLAKKTRNSGKYPVYGSGGISGTHDEPLVTGPGIVVGRKGTVGSVFWVDTDFFPIDTVFYVRPRDDYSLRWLYQALQYVDIAHLAADSAVPGVNRNSVHEQRFLLPPAETTAAYEEQTRAFIGHCRSLTLESETIQATRDNLLPALLNGRIALSELPQNTGRAV